MKKTLITLSAAMFSMTALTAPAHAGGDGLRIGVGIAGLLFNELAKGSHGGDRDRAPRRGDTLIGRVGEESTTRSSGRRSSGATAATSAVAVASLPEIGPEIEWRPDPASAVVADTGPAAEAPAPAAVPGIDNIETAAFVPPPAPPVVNPNAPIEAPAPVVVAPAPVPVAPVAPPVAVVKKLSGPIYMTDENGVLWGTVDAATAAKVEAGVNLGMKRSQAIAALSGLAVPADAQINADAEAAKIAQAKAAAEKKRNVELAAAQAKHDAELAAAEEKRKADDAAFDAALKAAAMKPAQTPTEAVAVVPAVEAPATVPAPVQQATTPAPVAAAPVAVAADPAPVVIDQSKTAAVSVEPKAPPAAPKPEKPKLDIDL